MPWESMSCRNSNELCEPEGGGERKTVLLHNGEGFQFYCGKGKSLWWMLGLSFCLAAPTLILPRPACKHFTRHLCTQRRLPRMCFSRKLMALKILQNGTEPISLVPYRILGNKTDTSASWLTMQNWGLDYQHFTIWLEARKHCWLVS